MEESQKFGEKNDPVKRVKNKINGRKTKTVKMLLYFTLKLKRNKSVNPENYFNDK